MNRLQKFIERRADGERSGRVAYAFASSLLPEPAEGMDWRVAPSFTTEYSFFVSIENCRPHVLVYVRYNSTSGTLYSL